MKEYLYICGQIFFGNTIETLQSLFSNTAIKSETRLSAHYTDGKYLKLSLNQDTRLKLEKINADEFIISGEADNQQQLITLAETVCKVLTAQKIKHRLELYDLDDKEFAYYHYNWERQAN